MSDKPKKPTFVTKPVTQPREVKADKPKIRFNLSDGPSKDKPNKG